MEPTSRNADTCQRLGTFVLRYGLVLIFLWFGSLKFTDYEAKGIEPLVMNSPIWAWAYHAFGLVTLAHIIGVIEIVIGLCIATRSFSPKLSALGSFGAVITYLITLSFMLTTPGIVQMGYSFPAISAMPGQFLLKDIILLGASIWTAGEALRAANGMGRDIR